MAVSSLRQEVTQKSKEGDRDGLADMLRTMERVRESVARRIESERSRGIIRIGDVTLVKTMDSNIALVQKSMQEIMSAKIIHFPVRLRAVK